MIYRVTRAFVLLLMKMIFVALLDSKYPSFSHQLTVADVPQTMIAGRPFPPLSPPDLSPVRNRELDHYKFLKYLKSGAQGSCSLYEHKDDTYRTKVVIKQIFGKYSPEQMKEAKIMVKCRHPFIVGIYEAFCQDESFHIVMQFAEGGNLAEYIHERRSMTPKHYFDEEQVLTYFTQVTMALDYLHKNKIIHRDLKPDNVLLNKTRQIAKLADFGISKILCDDTESRTVVGTSNYIAPEMCKAEPYDHFVDIWALGCVLYELSELEKAFRGSPAVLPMKIVNSEYDEPVHMKDKFLRIILDDCLKANKDDRRLTGEILRFPPILKTIAKLTCHLGIYYGPKSSY